MGQEFRFGNDPSRNFGEIRKRGFVSQVRQFFPSRPVAQFRLVAQGEQRLLAASGFALPDEGQYLVRSHEAATLLARRLGEGAVVAEIAAKLRERDEDFPGVRDEVAVPLIPEASGELSQLPGVCDFGNHLYN